MENVNDSSSGSQPPLSNVEQEVEAQTASQQCMPPPNVPRKRRGLTSPVWEHFNRIKDSKGKCITAICKYCAKAYNGQSKKHGTTNLRNHILVCLQHPASKDVRQSILSFQPVCNNNSDNNEGVLGTWIFNQEDIRRALAEMVVIDELPFRFVEKQGFRRFMLVCCLMFKIPSRWTVARDIYQIYSEEKMNQKKIFKTCTQRVSITTDTWTSIQRINYMCITAHYIDHEWKLQKKIISFVPVTSHKGEYIAKALETCLAEWGVRNIFTVTVDNAGNNDSALTILKQKLGSWGASSVKLKYLHMRCIAHIVNLVVKDGLSKAELVVDKVRAAVSYVRNSPARLKKFRDYAELIGVEVNRSLVLDVATRWNSTYLMLETVLSYQNVFEEYLSQESAFSRDLGEMVPDFMDWHSVECLVKILASFYAMTIRISGSLYVTSNNFFSEISDLSCILEDIINADSGDIEVMGTLMRSKFDKYWGDHEKMNFLIFYANILDPRDKAVFLPIQFAQLYGEEKGKLFLEKVLGDLKVLFEDYCVSATVPSTPSVPSSQYVSIGRPQSRLKSQLKRQRLESGERVQKKTELEVYLTEEILEEEGEFDILRWWKLNAQRFPILS